MTQAPNPHARKKNPTNLIDMASPFPPMPAAARKYIFLALVVRGLVV
jgi:hypothetical protein